MNMSKLITLVATIAVIGLPLTFSSVDVEAATTGKRVKRGSKKSSKTSKRTHRLSKKKKTSKKKRSATSRSRARRSHSTTRTRTTTVRQRSHAQYSNRRVVRRKTVVRHNTGHHVGRTSYRTSYSHHHTSSCTHHSHHSHSRVIVRHHEPRRTVVYRETRQTTHANSNASIRSSGGSSAEFYINGGLGMSNLRISEVSELPLNATNYRVAIGGKGELFGLELGVDGGNFAFDDGTSLNMIGINVDAKLQPSFGILEPYVFVGLGGYNLYDEVLEEDAGSGAFRAGIGADVRINNVGIGAKYTWSGYSFENDQSYQAISATSSIVSANLSFYF